MKMVKRILEVLALLFVVASIFGALFWPSQRSFICDDLLFPFAVVHVAILFFTTKKWRWLILLFAAMCAWGVMSDFLANDTIRTAPLGMLIRWMKWPLIIVTVASCSLPRVKKKDFINFIQFLFLGLVAINLILLINPFQWGELIHYFYAPKSEVLLGNYNEFGAFRLSGTMMNPNNNASVFGLFLLFFMSLNPKKYWKYCVMAFVLIFLTQSRTVLIIILAVIAIIVLRNNSRKANLILIPSGIVGVLLMLFVFRATNLVSILNGEAFSSNSWTQRMEHYSLFFDSSVSDKIVGHGIVLNPVEVLGLNFDSEYLSILFQYGIIGMIIWAAIVLYLPLLTRKISNSANFAWLILLFILGTAITNFVFLNVEVITLLSLILGTWFFLQAKEEIDNHSGKEADQQVV